jgi:endonuclease/exonuclease/phosphatase family metal-dependent hydrolase
LGADEVVIVTGDFNAAAERCEAWKILRDSGYGDAWLAATQRVGPETTFGDFQPPPAGKRERIDWILTRGPIHVQTCETVLYNRDGRYPSDHYPVSAKLAWVD